MPDPSTPVRTATGYKGADDASGKGGRARSQIMSDQVDAMAGNGTPSASSASSSSGGGRPHPATSSYAPSDNSSAVVSHVYGSPIEGNGPSK